MISMKLAIPELSLIALIGPSSAGKSTFARTHFLPTEVVSSDACRGLVSDDENSLEATSDAFEVLHYIAAKRLKRGRLTVVDATNVQREGRQQLSALAKQHHVQAVAVVFNLPFSEIKRRHEAREDRDFPEHVLVRQQKLLRQSIKHLKREGFRRVYVLNSPEEVDAVTIHREVLRTNFHQDHGPFDIIGDVHGCFDELHALLTKLGYAIETAETGYRVAAPGYRKAVFVGDLVDRGPNSPQVLRLVMDMVNQGLAHCIPGNHDAKLVRKLLGKNVKMQHGIQETWDQMAAYPPEFHAEVLQFLDGLVSHRVFAKGNLVVAHAGLREDMHGRSGGAVRSFALYGETTGETDEYGLPVRLNWAADYRGKATVVYGHTPVPEAQWLNNTIDIDTGCVFGGKLTALRYPERDLVSVPAARTYCEPAKPLKESGRTAQQLDDDLLNLQDFTGTKRIETRLRATIKVSEAQNQAALEIMSRYAVDPKWLLYLPPTMSPSETSTLPDYLEHPQEAFAYYRSQGLSKVVCEEKHMGSRVVVVVTKSVEVAQKRFGMLEPSYGVVYTRTGRRFFQDEALESKFLLLLQKALHQARAWEEFDTDWFALDAELMPWSAKAQALINEQYAPVGTAGTHSLASAADVMAQAAARGLPMGDLEATTRQRQQLLKQYQEAYRAYVHPTQGLEGLQLAPFHLLASEGRSYTDQPHLWHLATIAKWCEADPVLLKATAHRVVTLDEPDSVAEAVAWWESLTQSGGEGMVVKPETFITKGPKGLVQPAIKCRGREYLRIIYGPEYTLPEAMEALRNRSLGRKRHLALQEFALGVEALDRFVAKEPLHRTHECVFGVLAMESEPVDPRL